MTDEAAAGLDLLRDGFLRFEESVQAMQAGQASSSYAIAVPREFYAQWLAPRLAAFRREHPEVRFQLIADEDADFTEVNLDIAFRLTEGPGDLEGVKLAPGARVTVAAAGAEMLFFPPFQPEGNNILAEVRRMKELDSLVLMSDGALIEQSFLSAMGGQAQGMHFVGPSSADTEGSRGLAAAYERKYGEKPGVSYYQSAYDAAGLLFQAIEQIAVRHPDGSLSIGRDALRRALYATRDFKGVTGLLSCDQFGDCANPVFNVLRLDDHRAGVEGLQRNVLFTHAPLRERAETGKIEGATAK